MFHVGLTEEVKHILKQLNINSNKVCGISIYQWPINNRNLLFRLLTSLPSHTGFYKEEINDENVKVIKICREEDIDIFHNGHCFNLQIHNFAVELTLVFCYFIFTRV